MNPDIALQVANHTFENATSGFADSTGLFGPAFLFVLYAIAALAAAQFAAPWLAKSTILGTVGNAVLTALGYALKGLATTAVLGVVAAPLYLLATVEGSTRAVALEWVGYGIVAFAALVGVGWLADRAVTRYIEAHPDAEEWGDLWPEGEVDVAGESDD